MDVLTNKTKLTEFESTIIDNIEIAVWVMTGIGICVALSCLKNLCESVVYAFKCVYYIVCCQCCSPGGYRRQRDCNEIQYGVYKN
jgi:hypothetical protein